MKETPMPNSVTILALALSIVALLMSAYAASGVWKLTEGDLFGRGSGSEERPGDHGGDELSGSVEEQIEQYFQRQEAEAQRQAQEQARAQALAQEKVHDVSVDDDPIKGDPDAPITIVEWSDYQCPFCQRFYLNTLPELTEKYIDTGVAKLVYRDFPLDTIHPEARPAAIAAECAQELEGDDAYYAFHDQLFDNMNALGESLYLDIAEELDIDLGQFETCLADPKMNDEVNKDFEDGQAVGVRGTPAFFVNGRMLSGAQPFEAFEALIEDELKKQ